MKKLIQIGLLAVCLTPPALSQSANEFIVFSSERSGSGDIYAMPVSGGVPMLVAGTGAAEGRPRFASVQGTLYYFRYDGAEAMLMQGEDEIVALPFDDISPDISAAGNEMIYSAPFEDREAIFTLAFDPEAADADPQVRNSYPTPRYPAFSPVRDFGEGAYAYVHMSDEGALLQVWRSAVRIGESPLVTLYSAAYIGHPAWSPDGQNIAFDVRAGEDTDIAIVPLHGGQVRLFERPGNDFAPAFSADGQTIAFGGEIDGDFELFTLSVATGDFTRLTYAPGFDGAPVFVPATAFDD